MPPTSDGWLDGADHGCRLEAVRQQVEAVIGQSEQAPPGYIPFTPHAKKVLVLSLREALEFSGQKYIATEHMLLGILREGDSVAAQVLVGLGADLNQTRQQVIQLYSCEIRAPAPPSRPTES
jgi:ATP-dependent Clp protease ATP-binding subunit ClpC